MSDPDSTSPGLSEIIGRLEKANDKLLAQNGRLTRTVERLTREVERLRKALEEALRAGKRQASPFSKDDPKKDPKKPGRKKGAAHGPTHLRPPPDHVDRFCDAALPECCAECGGSVGLDHVAVQYQWDLPPIKPVVTQFNVHVGHCADCGARVQGRHPEQTSDALGAAGCQIGPNAFAIAVHLNKIVGASYSKIAVFFRALFELELSPTTLVRALQRISSRLQPAYLQIRAEVRSSAVVYPDETGWRVGGRKAWLWVFVGDRAVLYVVARYRGFSVAAWALGKNFSGYLGHDGWSVYDRFHAATHQTCLGHLLVRCKELLDVATRRAVSFPRDLKEILKDAFRLRDRVLEGAITAHGVLCALGRLKARLESLLAMTLTHDGNRRLAKHIQRHADELFTFISAPALLEGTNWPAEHEIRPAVIARKMSGCNKTWRGAHAHEVLVSTIRTAVLRGARELRFIVDALRTPTSADFLPTFLAGP